MAVDTLPKWQLWVHRFAEDEIKRFKRLRPDLVRKMTDEFKQMSLLDDPRHFHHVKALCGAAKGWYRLALYEENFRIVFRLLRLEDGKFIEVWPEDKIAEAEELNCQGIQITRAAPRGYAYDNDLYDRLKRVK